MKKLVSICFFSIMFLVLSVQAQDCCFRLSNPNGAILTDISNVPGGLKVDHQLTPLATLGRTDVYDMVFSNANCLGIDYETGKVSVEWELWCDGHQVTTDLSNYCTLSFQTRYNELQWIGGAVATGASAAQDYPGAIQQYQGTYNISNIAFDYFYFKFLANTQSRIVINWNQAIHDVMLVVRVRERLNGTNNELYWNEGQNLNIGGHQSQPGRILAADTLTSDPYFTATRIIKDCEDVVVGRPTFTMHATGIYNIAYYDNTCGNRIDSIITYDYTHYSHPTDPVVADVEYCQYDEADTIRLPLDPNPDLADHVNDIVTYWSTDGGNTYFESSYFVPRTDVVEVRTIYVKRHDNVTGCESNPTTFLKTINKLPSKPLVSLADRYVEYCVGNVPVALKYIPDEGMRVLWGDTPDDITSWDAPTPTATAAGTQVYYLKIQNKTTKCISLGYDSIIVKVFDNPVVTITSDNDTLCQKEKATLKAEPADLTSYQWFANDEMGPDTPTYKYTNKVLETGYVSFIVAVTEAHAEATCKSKSDVYKIYAYETIGSPAALRGDTALCGPGTTTLTVKNAENASTSVWYDAKSESANELGRGTSYTAQFNTTTTVYVASQNDFGCETPVEDWIAIKVIVNSIPQIVLTADNDGEVCAEEKLKIYSEVTEYESPITYAWSGNGVQDPTDQDFVVFKNDVAGIYTVTLKVNDGNSCKNEATIDITVDTLPIIVNGVDFTVANNDYCVGSHGSITFTTEYVIYTINGADWQDDPNFEGLAAGLYYPSVEDGNGCKAHPVTVEITDAPIMPAVTTTNEGNTQCGAPYTGKLIAHVTPSATYNYKLDDGAFQADSVFSELTHDYTYTVVVKDMTTGCTDTAFNQVVADNRPVMNITADILPNTHCTSQYDGKITVNVAVQDDRTTRYKYELDGPMPAAQQFSNVFDTLIDGNYTVTVTETLSGCEKSEDFVVADERATITMALTQTPNTHCVAPFDGKIEVVADPAEGSYHYSIDGGAYYQLESTFTGLEQAFYTVTVEDLYTFCKGEDTITVKYAGVLPTATINALDNYCYGDTAGMSVSTAGSVKFQEWSYSGPSATDTILISSIRYRQRFSLSGFTAGDHIFTAHFIDTITLCENTVSDTVRVIPVNIDLTASKNAACVTDSIKIFCTYFPDKPALDTLISYYWQSSSSWHYAAPAVYDSIFVTPKRLSNRVTIKVTDNHGCTNSKFIDVWGNELPEISFIAATAIPSYKDYCEGATTSIKAVSSHFGANQYKWTKGGTTIATSQTVETSVGTADFDLNVEITDGLGCKNDSTFTVNVITKPGAPNFNIGDPASTTHYFCDSLSITVNTSVQYAPAVPNQVFKWNTDTPEVKKAAGVYTAHWEVTENGVTCKSGDSTVTVVVEPAEITSATMKYNTEFTTSTSHTRCYDTTVTDMIHIDVTPVASSTLLYTYKLNGVDTTADMNITRTQSGTYYDTVTVILERVNPNGSHCYDTVTRYYTLTINPLPTAPSNFPTYEVAGYKTIFRCDGSDASYDFSTGTTHSLKYKDGSGSYSTIAPKQSDNVITLKVTDVTVTPNCENTFEYKIVKVENPTNVTVTTSLDSAYCGSSSVTGNFFAAVEPAALSQSYNQLTYTWCNSELLKHTSYLLNDTLYSATFYTDTTVSVSVTVKAGGTNQYSVTCGPKTGSKFIDFQTIPTKPILSTSVPGYISLTQVGYCDNGDSLTSVNITTSDFSTDPVSAEIYIVGGTITGEGTYKIYAQNPDGLKCTSDTLTLTVTKYRTINKPNGFVSDTAYCASDNRIALSFTAENPSDSLVYFKGSTLLTSIPDTAGSYSVKVVNKEFKACHIHEDFNIAELTNPSLEVYITNADTNKLCQGEAYGNVETSNVVEPTTSSVKYYWNGSAIEGSSSLYIGEISADSIVKVGAIARYTYADYDITCKSDSVKDQIVINYYAKPAAPTFIGSTTSFCEGNTLLVQPSDFNQDATVSHPLTLSTDPLLAYTFDTSGTVKASSYYTDFVSCYSDTTTVTITENPLPTVTISPDSKIVCADSSATFTASGAVTYRWSNDSTTAAITVSTVGTYIVTGTDANSCVNKDTVELKNYDTFTVTMSNDTLICKNNSVEMTATVVGTTSPYTYAWYKDGDDLSKTTSSITEYFSELSEIVHGEPVPFEYSVKVTDKHGCISVADSNVVNVEVDDRAQIVFLPSNELTSRVGDNTDFQMYIDANCWNPNEKVYIDFQFYKDGVPMTTQELSQTLESSEVNSVVYNTQYLFDIVYNAPDLTGRTAKASNYNQASDFIPRSEFLTLNDKVYTWFYMHFLDQRRISVNFGTWLKAGNYTVTYAVIRADNNPAQIQIPYNGWNYIGGYNGHGTVKDTVAFDMIHITVDSLAGSYAPVSIVTVDEDSHNMNMTVYPNPADNNVNVVLNGVKGQTVITVHDMSGKAISSQRVNVDYDGQLYNLPVSNYAQGIYFIKVVNGDAVMTKKLIIAR